MTTWRAIALAIWSLLLFVLGAIFGPVFNRLGESLIDRFYPPKAELKMEVIEQTSSELRVYVTNNGRGQAVLEEILVCPPNDGALVNIKEKRRIEMRDAISDQAAGEIVFHVFKDRLSGWHAECYRPGGMFLNLPLLKGDRRVPAQGAAVVSFEAPDGFVLYSGLGRQSLMIGSWCVVFLQADEAYQSKVFPCAVGAIPGEGPR